MKTAKLVPSAGYRAPTGVRVTSIARHLELSTPHSPLRTRHHRGFTLLELITVICIVAILAGMFLSRIPYYQEQAEKTVMEQMAGAIQSSLVMRYGSLMTHGAATEKNLSALATDNPISWLQQKPRNYAGEFYDPASKAVAPGSWMFDLKSHELIYVLDHSEYFTPGKDGQKWVRFHVKLEYESLPGGLVGDKKALTSTLFEPTETYRWFN